WKSRRPARGREQPGRPPTRQPKRRKGIQRECGPGAQIRRDERDIVSPENAEENRRAKRCGKECSHLPKRPPRHPVGLAGATIIRAVGYIIYKADIGRAWRHREQKRN